MTSDKVLPSRDHLFERHNRTMESVAAQLCAAENLMAAAQKRIMRSSELVKKKPLGPSRSSKNGSS